MFSVLHVQCLDFVGVKSCLQVYPKNNAPVIWTHGGHNFVTDEGVDLPMQVGLDDTDAGLGLMTLVVCAQYGTVGFDLLLPNLNVWVSLSLTDSTTNPCPSEYGYAGTDALQLRAVLMGSLASLKQAGRLMKYTPLQCRECSSKLRCACNHRDTVSLHIDDKGNTGSGGPLTATTLFTVQANTRTPASCIDAFFLT